MLIITFNILYIMIDLQSYVLSQTIQITNDSTICMYQNQRLAVVYHQVADTYTLARDDIPNLRLV